MLREALPAKVGLFVIVEKEVRWGKRGWVKGWWSVWFVLGFV
jgi:hypothetical protein